MPGWSGKTRRVKTMDAKLHAEARYNSGAREAVSAAQAKRARKAAKNLRDAASGGMSTIE